MPSGVFSLPRHLRPDAGELQVPDLPWDLIGGGMTQSPVSVTDHRVAQFLERPGYGVVTLDYED